MFCPTPVGPIISTLFLMLPTIDPVAAPVSWLWRMRLKWVHILVARIALAWSCLTTILIEMGN